ECDGCIYDGRCLPYGTRRPSAADIDSPVYCELNSKFVEQKFDDSNCQNNYECMGNSCIGGKCTDLGKEMKETRNMIQRFWDWLKGVF
ncbi:MAG: hypothetical protein NDI94_03035, partial [Candidatus Woesearchaeota archaeon]|nr:hypothetical protein [Candidatus Woesearchaeota archaeon]